MSCARPGPSVRSWVSTQPTKQHFPAPLTPPQPATETYLLPGGEEIKVA